MRQPGPILSVVWNAVVFSASRYALLVLSVVRNGILAKILGPADFGTWVVISLLFTLGDQVHLGLRHAGEREIPFQRGRGEAEISEKVESVVLGGILMLSGFALAVSMVASVVFPPGGTLKGLLPFIGMIIAVEQVNRYYLMILRTKERFVASSRVETMMELARTAVVITLVLLWGIPGLVAGFLLVSIMLSMFVAKVHGIVRPRVEWHALKALVRQGIPLFLVGILFVVLLNLDRVVGSVGFSRAELGIYGIAAMIAQLPLSFSQAVGTVLYPSLNERFGETNEIDELFGLFSRAVYGIAYFIPVVAATVYFGALMVLDLFFPSYSAAAHVLTILLPGILFVSLVPLFSGVLTASARTRSFFITELIALLGSIVIIFVTMSWLPGDRVSSLGIAMTISMIFFGSLMTVVTYRHFKIPSGRFLSEVVKSHFPFVYCIAILYGVLPVLMPSDSIAQVLERYGVFVLLYLPILAAGYFMVRPGFRGGVQAAENG